MADTEDLFDVLENDRGELMLVIHARSGAPDRPLLVVDGPDSALFYRNRSTGQVVRLPDIDRGVMPGLRDADSVAVAEMDDQDRITTSYRATVRAPKTPGVS